MSEHYNKQTVEATVWCARCGKNTPHRVFDGRRQHCLICAALREAESQRAKRQGELFKGNYEQDKRT
jgi:hypothetical protein